MRPGLSRAVSALLGVGMSFAPALAQSQNPRTDTQSVQQPREGTESPDKGDNKLAAPTGTAPAGTPAPVDPKTYKIGPGDVLMVRVWGEGELSGPVQVRPDGMITLPLVGELKASEQTPEQTTNAISEALAKYINKPQVMVSVQAVLSKKYYMTGEVNRTGPFPLVVPTTIVEALSNAGGFRDFANKKKIVIIRGTQRLKFNYNNYLKGKDLDQNIMIQDGDQVYVP
jgi:polysaccharide export outer membrane protein